jgi:hypothetical protein
MSNVLNFISIYLNILYQWYVLEFGPELHIYINIFLSTLNTVFHYSLLSQTGDILRTRTDDITNTMETGTDELWLNKKYEGGFVMNENEVT